MKFDFQRNGNAAHFIWAKFWTRKKIQQRTVFGKLNYNIENSNNVLV